MAIRLMFSVATQKYPKPQTTPLVPVQSRARMKSCPSQGHDAPATLQMSLRGLPHPDPCPISRGRRGGTRQG